MEQAGGKGWARGRTAATDQRVANAAAAHRGKTYQRHLPPELDRRHLNGHGDHARRTLPLEWSPAMAYVVGLMATDGCLISGRRQLNFKSADESLVKTFLTCLGRPPTPKRRFGRTDKPHYLTQFGDAAFYDWLRSVGLMPRKSLVLGAIAVPGPVFLDCVRGLLDGDGSILNYWYDGGGKAAGRRYEGLTTRFVSGSRSHIEWLREALRRVLGISGNVAAPSPGDKCWALNYAIRESCVLLPQLYPTDEVPRLERKWMLWKDYARRHGHPATLRERSTAGGRSIAG